MPEEQQERRAGDILIMDKLATMHTELALNTRETTRLAEYQKTMNGKVVQLESRLQSAESNQTLVSANLTNMMQDRKDDKNTIVTQDEFKPIRMVVYGLVGLILTGVLTAVLTMVIRQQ